MAKKKVKLHHYKNHQTFQAANKEAGTVSFVKNDKTGLNDIYLDDLKYCDTQIGGQNLITSTMIQLIEDFTNSVTIPYEALLPYNAGDPFTLSFEYNISADDTAANKRFTAKFQNVNILWDTNVVVDGQWHYVYASFKIPEGTPEDYLKLYLTDYGDIGNRTKYSARTRNIKLEKGNKPSSFISYKDKLFPQIGNRNLFSYEYFKKNYGNHYWESSNSITFPISKADDNQGLYIYKTPEQFNSSPQFGLYCIAKITSDGNEQGYPQDIIDVTNSKKYVVSVSVKATGIIKDFGWYERYKILSPITLKPEDGWVRMSYVYDYTRNTDFKPVAVRGEFTAANIKLYYKDYQVQEGTVETAFVPAPEDILAKCATKEELQNLDINIFNIVSQLPNTGEENKVYLVPSQTASGQNIYKEYVYLASSNEWEQLGELAANTDLSEYAKKQELNQVKNELNTEIQQINTIISSLSSIDLGTF